MPRVRGAFTLFELLLVLLLIVISYGLFAQNFSMKSPEEESVKLEKLNLYLAKIGGDKNLVSLRCIDNCNECKVLVEGNDTDMTLNIFEKDNKVNAYRFDGKRLEKVEFDDYYINEYKREKVCFRMDVYPNGSSDELVLEYKNRAYLFENYINEGRVFDTVANAQDFLEKRQLEIKGR
ncbi:MAG: hypothetical protein LBP40_00990 [Campylobacteraceae bacterium]|jgi:CRISPR/Cas system-associated protein Cas5 (RAMP superfamily)|nr:hypothetical protein [Campylobacteraceae bacterium]